MASSNYDCDVRQGFNFEKDAQKMVGHLVYLKVGQTEFKADLNVTNPLDNTKQLKVVSVLSNLAWSGGYADPVTVFGQVSNENRKAAELLVHNSLQDTDVIFQFNVFTYDPKAKEYYKCCHTNDANLNGLVMKRSGDLDIRIAAKESGEVVSPLNYGFYVGVAPAQQTEQMAIQFAVSNTDKFSKQYGVPVDNS